MERLDMSTKRCWTPRETEWLKES